MNKGSSECALVNLCYVVLYYNIGTGTSTAGQAGAGSVFQLTCHLVLFMLLLCVLAPRLN